MKKVLRKLLVFCGVVTCLFMMSFSSMAATKGYFNVYKTGAGTGDVLTQTVYVNSTSNYIVKRQSGTNNASATVKAPTLDIVTMYNMHTTDYFHHQPTSSTYNSFKVTLVCSDSSGSCAGYIGVN